MISLDQAVPITLKSELKIVCINPAEYSFFTCIGLSFFYSASKSLTSQLTIKSLQSLYSFYPSISELLENKNLSTYYLNFKTFCENLQSQENILEYAMNSSNQFLNTLYYYFHSLFCVVNRFDDSQAYQIYLPGYAEILQNLSECLNINLIVYTNSKEYSFGSGLILEIYQDDYNQFSLVIEKFNKIEESYENNELDELFSIIPMPVTDYEMKVLMNWIDDYENSGKTITKNMIFIKEYIQEWKCGHDRKEFETDCGQKHCIFCLFDHIKRNVPEKATCLCGHPLNFVNFSKIISEIEPNHNVKYTCDCCSVEFFIFSSIKCQDHFTCMSCRSQNIKNCVKCQRILNESEKNIIGEFNGTKTSKCIYCGKYNNEHACKNFCQVCNACYDNLKRCPGCQSDTNLKIKIICVDCKKEIIGKPKIYDCNHPSHISKKKDVCGKNCTKCSKK